MNRFTATAKDLERQYSADALTWQERAEIDEAFRLVGRLEEDFQSAFQGQTPLGEMLEDFIAEFRMKARSLEAGES